MSATSLFRLKPIQLAARLLLVGASMLSGCVAMIHHAVVSRLPTFEQTSSSWPQIPDDKGRVVFYWPRLGGLGFNPNPFSGPGGMGIRAIRVGAVLQTELIDQTFMLKAMGA